MCSANEISNVMDKLKYSHIITITQCVSNVIEKVCTLTKCPSISFRFIKIRSKNYNPSWSIVSLLSYNSIVTFGDVGRADNKSFRLRKFPVPLILLCNNNWNKIENFCSLICLRETWCRNKIFSFYSMYIKTMRKRYSSLLIMRFICFEKFTNFRIFNNAFFQIKYSECSEILNSRSRPENLSNFWKQILLFHTNWHLKILIVQTFL